MSETAADATASEAAVSALRPLVSADPDPLLNQRVAQLLSQMDWSRIGIQERSAWLDFVREQVLSADDRQFVADAVAGKLMDVDRDLVLPIVTDAFQRSPSIRLAAILYMPTEGAPDMVVRWVVEQSLAAIEQRRSDARSGRFALGDDVLGLLGWVLDESSQAEIWDAVVAYLLDPLVASVHKVPLLRALAERTTQLPSSVRRRLVDGLQRRPEQTGEMPIFSAADEVAGITLRLLVRLRALDGETLLARLLELMGSRSPIVRTEALVSLSDSVGTISVDTLVTVALTLSYDAQEVVRGEAGRALALLASGVDEAVAPVVERRLVDLLAEPGAQVPYVTLYGLRASNARNSAAILGMAQRLAVGHPSSQVRSAARGVLGPELGPVTNDRQV